MSCRSDIWKHVKGGSEEYLYMRNPVETDGSRSDPHQQGSSWCLREPHVSLLYFARTPDTCRQEVGWGMVEGEQFSCEETISSWTSLWIFFWLSVKADDLQSQKSLCLSFSLKETISCLRNNYEDLFFLLFSFVFFFLSENNFSSLLTELIRIGSYLSV